MKKGTTKIEKALSPEEKSVIANVKSLLDQLEQMEQAEEPADGTEGVAMAAEPNMGLPEGDDEQEDLEEEEIEVNKSEDASAGAEERIGELPVEDEEALKVLKAIMNLSGGKVRKSARSSRPSFEAQVVRVLKSLSERVDQQGEALAGMLEGFGVTPVQKAARPINPRQASAGDLVAALTQALRIEKSAAPAEEDGDLSDVAKSLWQR